MGTSIQHHTDEVIQDYLSKIQPVSAPMTHMIKMRRKMLLLLRSSSHTIASLVVVALRSCSRVFTLFSYSFLFIFSFCLSSASPIGLQWFYSLLFFHRVSHCVAVGCLLFCSPEFPLLVSGCSYSLFMVGLFISVFPFSHVTFLC